MRRWAICVALVALLATTALAGPSDTLEAQDVDYDHMAAPPAEKVIGTTSTVASNLPARPIALTVDDATSTVYVLLENSNQIYKLDAAGNPTVLAGSQAAGFVDNVVAASAMFNRPVDLAYDTINKILYVADAGNNRIRKISLAGGQATVTTFAGSGQRVSKDGGATDCGFAELSFLFLERASRTFYVGDGERVVRITTNDPKKAGGISVDTLIPDSLGYYRGKTIQGISYNFRTNFVYVAYGAEKLSALDGMAGQMKDVRFPARSETPSIQAVSTDSYNGLLFACDTANNAIYRVVPGKEPELIAGGSRGSADGQGSAVSFDGPSDMYLDRINGVLYVADANNRAIRRVVAQGVIKNVLVFLPGSRTAKKSVSIKPGDQVVIMGENLGAGTDIGEVRIQNLPAALHGQGVNWVHVEAPPTIRGDTEGDIEVFSNYAYKSAAHYFPAKIEAEPTPSPSLPPTPAQGPEIVHDTGAVRSLGANFAGLYEFDMFGNHEKGFDIRGKVLDKNNDVRAYKWTQVAGPEGADPAILRATGTPPEDPKLKICNVRPGTYDFVLQVQDSQSLKDAAAYRVEITKAVKDHPPALAASVLTGLVWMSIACAILAAMYGNKLGNELSVIMFVLFIASLVSFDVSFDRCLISFYSVFHWAFHWLPLKNQPMRDAYPGHLIYRSEPLPSEDNRCPIDQLYLWSDNNAAWSLVWLLVVPVLGLLAVMAYKTCCIPAHRREHVSGRRSWWKMIYYVFAALAYGAALHAFRVLRFHGSPYHRGGTDWKVVVAWIVVLFVTAVVGLLLLFLLVNVARKALSRFANFRYQSSGLFGVVGVWQAARGGESFHKMHGSLFRKYTARFGGFLYLPAVELGKRLVQAAVLGLGSDAPRQCITLLVLEAVHVVYLIVARPFARTLNTVIEVITCIVEAIALLIVRSIALDGGNRGLSCALWKLLAFWLFVLCLVQFMWQIWPYLVDVWGHVGMRIGNRSEYTKRFDPALNAYVYEYASTRGPVGEPNAMSMGPMSMYGNTSRTGSAYGSSQFRPAADPLSPYGQQGVVEDETCNSCLRKLCP